jgi:hypothetical protein
MKDASNKTVLIVFSFYRVFLRCLAFPICSACRLPRGLVIMYARIASQARFA